MTKVQANISMILYATSGLLKWHNSLCVDQSPPRCNFRSLAVSRLHVGCVVLRRPAPYPIEGHGTGLRTFFCYQHPRG